MLTIETSRLIIRNFRSSDAKDLRQMILKYSSSPYGIYDHKWPTSEQEIQGVTDWFAAGDQFFAICLKETGQFIGLISLSRSDNTERCEYDLGYIFDANYHRTGYATEGCRALIDHAFAEWKAQRVITGTAAINEPSCRLLARLGFKKISESTGHLQVAPNGTPYDFLGFTFELTREEWTKIQPA